MFHPKYTSFLITLNILYSIYNRLYFNSFLETCVLVTSIIYHHNLIENFRNYDILIANSVALHHFYLYSYHISSDKYTIYPLYFICYQFIHISVEDYTIVIYVMDICIFMV
jgi:hypothetical protein